MNTKSKILKIDKQNWNRGKAQREDEWNAPFLLNYNGYADILGFLFIHFGYYQNLLAGLSFPAEVYELTPHLYPKELFFLLDEDSLKNHVDGRTLRNSEITHRLIYFNDTNAIGELDRELRITDQLNQLGFEVHFV